MSVQPVGKFAPEFIDATFHHGSSGACVFEDGTDQQKLCTFSRFCSTNDLHFTRRTCARNNGQQISFQQLKPSAIPFTQTIPIFPVKISSQAQLFQLEARAILSSLCQNYMKPHFATHQHHDIVTFNDRVRPNNHSDIRQSSFCVLGP